MSPAPSTSSSPAPPAAVRLCSSRTTAQARWPSTVHPGRLPPEGAGLAPFRVASGDVASLRSSCYQTFPAVLRAACMMHARNAVCLLHHVAPPPRRRRSLPAAFRDPALPVAFNPCLQLLAPPAWHCRCQPALPLKLFAKVCCRALHGQRPAHRPGPRREWTPRGGSPGGVRAESNSERSQMQGQPALLSGAQVGPACACVSHLCAPGQACGSNWAKTGLDKGGMGREHLLCAGPWVSAAGARGNPPGPRSPPDS